MGQFSLFLPSFCSVCWLALFESFGSVSGIGTTPAFFWRMIRSLAMGTRCNCFRCRRFRVLQRKVIFLFLFFFHSFTEVPNDVASFLH